MKDKILADLNSEKENLLNQLKERRTQESELDKALTSTRKDLSVLEGRLLELNAILEYVEGVTEDSTVVTDLSQDGDFPTEN